MTFSKNETWPKIRDGILDTATKVWESFILDWKFYKFKKQIKYCFGPYFKCFREFKYFKKCWFLSYKYDVIICKIMNIFCFDI